MRSKRFDFMDMEAFHTYFNDSIHRYGCVTVSELINNPLLMGDENSRYVTSPYLESIGWNESYQRSTMFIKKEDGFYLNLPGFKKLGVAH